MFGCAGFSLQKAWFHLMVYTSIGWRFRPLATSNRARNLEDLFWQTSADEWHPLFLSYICSKDFWWNVHIQTAFVWQFRKNGNLQKPNFCRYHGRPQDQEGWVVGYIVNGCQTFSDYFGGKPCHCPAMMSFDALDPKLGRSHVKSQVGGRDVSGRSGRSGLAPGEAVAPTAKVLNIKSLKSLKSLKSYFVPFFLLRKCFWWQLSFCVWLQPFFTGPDFETNLCKA